VARVKAMQIKAQIAVGNNLAEKEIKIKSYITFGKMFEEYIKRYSGKEKA
jgi:hypothetical protein